MASTVSLHKPAHAEVLKLLSEFSVFGATDAGGVSRLACGQEDAMARNHLVAWFKDNDFDVQIDEIGNVFGWVDFGVGDNNKTFLCGSHLDSQPDGGRFDGALGVVTAMSLAKALKRAVDDGDVVPTYGKFAVVAWTSEEGARFQPSLLGSSVFVGELSNKEALSIQDSEGVTVAQALADIGFLGADRPTKPDYYFELHIEQGTTLQEAGNNIGVVERCWGAVKLLVTARGRADHTGPTPMDIRRDALLAASHLIVVVNELSKDSMSDLHSSVGRIEVSPNSPNTIADTVKLWIELRSDDQSALSAAVKSLKEHSQVLATSTGCTVTIEAEEHRPVVTFDEAGRDIVAAAISAAGLKVTRMSTIAGHDAINLQSICPASLIFVPSHNGITHSPDEFTSDDDVLAGFDASLAAVTSLLATPLSHSNTGAQYA